MITPAQPMITPNDRPHRQADIGPHLLLDWRYALAWVSTAQPASTIPAGPGRDRRGPVARPTRTPRTEELLQPTG